MWALLGVIVGALHIWLPVCWQTAQHESFPEPGHTEMLKIRVAGSGCLSDHEKSVHLPWLFAFSPVGGLSIVSLSLPWDKERDSGVTQGPCCPHFL